MSPGIIEKMELGKPITRINISEGHKKEVFHGIGDGSTLEVRDAEKGIIIITRSPNQGYTETKLIKGEMELKSSGLKIIATSQNILPFHQIPEN